MKKTGVLSFFPAFAPPRSGGELRLHHIAMHLAQHGFQVEMASPTHSSEPAETVDHHERFREHRCPKTRLYHRAHVVLDRLAGFRECSGLVCSLVGKHHKELVKLARQVTSRADIVTHESPFLLPLLPRRRKAGQYLVYNSYNVESKMARDMFGRTPQGWTAARWVRRLEGRLVRESDLVLACSEADAQDFVRLYGIDRAKIAIVPNGVDVEHITPCNSLTEREAARALLDIRSSRPACFFIGSYHPPNLEAVEIILENLAPGVPEVDFLVAGKVCEGFQDRVIPPNVRMLGVIAERERLALLHGCDVALNPMVSGSGTNLKMLDYLAAGLPILSTLHGARGLDLESERHALLLQPDELRQGLEELLGDPLRARTLGEAGRQLAEERFSWRKIGESVAEIYTLKTSRKRIVILNDFPVTPAQQGGQVRIDAVARELAGEGQAVTILALTREKEGRREQPSPSVEELNVPRSALHRVADGVLAQICGCTADDASAMLFTRRLTPQLRRVLRRELRGAKDVLLIHPYLEPVTRQLPKGRNLYFDSLNTEYELKSALYRKGVLANSIVRCIRQAEARASLRSRAVFCVSEENRADLVRLAPEIRDRSYVAPNGVDCERASVLPREEKRGLRRRAGLTREYVAIFLGSGHPPNHEAARLIIDTIARQHPRVLFLLVGSVCGWFWGQHVPGNVLLMGMVSERVKNFLLSTSDFALNPMLTGSGTSLKMFDYMASGLPVLSTVIGARGLDEEAREAILLVKPAEFSRTLRKLMANPAECAELSRKAREAALEQSDWHVTLRPMREVIAGAQPAPSDEIRLAESATG